MDFSLSKTQAALQDKARTFLGDSISTQLVRDAERSEDGFSRAIWEKFAQNGWAGMTIPKEFGGAGGPILDSCILLEEIGRAGASTPMVVSSGLSAAILQAAPRSAERDRCLKDIAAGKIISAALIDPQGRNEWGVAHLPITANGESFSLTGKKVLVPYGSAADELLVSAVSPNGDLAIVLIDSAAEGVTKSRHHSGAGVPLASIEFKDAHVSQERVLLQGEGVREVVHQGLLIGALLSTAEAIGFSKAIKNMTAEYVSNRMAFGRPIGAFQAVAHPCADMHISNETIRMLTYEAAWRLDNGKEAVEEVMSTKALANELFERVANDAFCVHGAQGFYEGCDLQLFMRRIRSFCVTMGESHECLERAALSIGM